ncbi:MAG: zinc ribbon domain-containing protein [Deltaproteobacteria bacterium]|nr:MAG: zinc ribbon domain-containing protein [Deltaproteobacteria bacterium]
MPIYEYQCTNCGRIFEVMQNITEQPLQACKYCSGKLQRLISLTNFQLKGTGWYATDYQNKQEKEEKPSHKREEKSDKKSEK